MPSANERSTSPIHKKRSKQHFRNSRSFSSISQLHSTRVVNSSVQLDRTLAALSPQSITEQDRINVLLFDALTPYMQHSAGDYPLETSHVSEASDLIDAITSAVPNDDFLIPPSISYPLWGETSPMSNESHSEHTTPVPPSDSNGRNGDNRRGGDGNNRRPPRGRRTAPTSNLRCDICHQFYSRRDNLRVHQRVHSGERPYQCSYCHKPFRWLGALRTHESNHQRDGDQVQPRNTPIKTEPTEVSSDIAGPSQVAVSVPQVPVSSPVSASQPQLPGQSPNISTYPSQIPPHPPQTAAYPSNAQMFGLQVPTSIESGPSLQQPVAPQMESDAPRPSDGRPPELNLDIPASGQDLLAPSPGPFVSEEDPGDSPLFHGSQDRWTQVLDDTLPDELRER